MKVHLNGAAHGGGLRLACLRMLCLCLFLGSVPGMVLALTWPSVSLPDDVQAHEVGEQITVNGHAMRMQAFVSKRSPQELADWFKQAWGSTLVENTVHKKQVLGRANGEFYETVQLEASPDGTRGLTALTHLKGTADQTRTESRARLARWLARMPTDTKVVTDMAANDRGKASFYLVLTNTYSEEVNRDKLISLLTDEGYTPQRLSELAPSAQAQQLEDRVKTLFFKGPNKEAMATIARDGKGRTFIVLNTVNATATHSLESFK